MSDNRHETRNLVLGLAAILFSVVVVFPLLLVLVLKAIEFWVEGMR